MSVNCVRAKFVTCKLANTSAHTRTPNTNGHKDFERLLVKNRRTLTKHKEFVAAAV